MDDVLYALKQEETQVSHEALCRRCGACCGADGSEPCSKLGRDDKGHYHCTTYEDRLGPQVTVNGKPFTCVEIRDVLKEGVTYNGCGYRNDKERS